MNVEELKQEIVQCTGIPATLLTGETAEENIAQAKALLAYRRENEAIKPRSNAEQFAEWARAEWGSIEPQDAMGTALADLEERVRVEGGGYPRLADSGEVDSLPDPRSAREQFAEWLGNKCAYDPFRSEGGWKLLN